MFSEKRFKAQMILAGVTSKELAEQLHIHPTTLYRKIQNNGDFSREEIARMVEILKIENPQDIFFAPELTETQVGR